jgi:NAD(P)-dependent dehydrogenase (short-subunit alcohol dehydrogenase family)
MEMGITGKIALVTGGSRGIGRAIAMELAAEGCKVAVVARDLVAIDETVEDIRRVGGEAAGFSADLSRLESYNETIAAIRVSYGDPNIAVFNMREPKPGLFEELTEADYAEAFHLTVLCYSRMVREVAPAMKQAKWGRIVSIGSMSSKQPVRPSAGFSYDLANASRIAAVAVMKSAAHALAPHGVTVNSIATGSFNTDYALAWFRERAMEHGISIEKYLENIRTAIPLGRLGDTREIAALCAFLCSQRGGYTTGDSILCDGGITNCLS